LTLDLYCILLFCRRVYDNKSSGKCLEVIVTK
jgi:hypothetical protein